MVFAISSDKMIIKQKKVLIHSGEIISENLVLIEVTENFVITSNICLIHKVELSLSPKSLQNIH